MCTAQRAKVPPQRSLGYNSQVTRVARPNVAQTELREPDREDWKKPFRADAVPRVQHRRPPGLPSFRPSRLPGPPMFASLGPDLSTFSESHNAAVGGLLEALCDKVYQQVSSQVAVLVAASVAGLTSDLRAMEQKQMTSDQKLHTIEETLQNFLHNMQGFADDPPPPAPVKETIIVKETIVVEQVVVGPSEEEKAAEKAAETAAKLAEAEARVKEAQLKAEEDARLAAEAAEAARLRDESDAASKAELERLAAEAAASAARAEEMLLQAGKDRAEAERLEAERREADRLAAEAAASAAAAAEAAASAAAAAAVANAELRVENTPEASARARKYWKWAFSRIKAKNLVRRMVFSMSTSRAPKGQSIMERMKSLEGLCNDHKNQFKAQEESAEVRDRRRR